MPPASTDIAELRRYLRKIDARCGQAQIELQAIKLELKLQAMKEALEEGADALLVPSSPRFSLERQPIIEATAGHRIPAMYEWGDIARAGGLMAYGPVLASLYRLVASYVDRIFKGANPSELPIEEPKRFELVVNLKVAKALALTMPTSILIRTDQVIE